MESPLFCNILSCIDFEQYHVESLAMRMGCDNSELYQKGQTITVRILQYGFLVLAFFQIVLGLSRSLFPYDLDQSTVGFMVSNLLLEGKNPWDLNVVLNEPYCITNYGVFYNIFFAIGQMILGEQYFFMRFISFISCFGICFIVYHLASGRYHKTEIMNLNQNQWKFNQTGGLIALVLILSSPAFIMNNSIGRSDNFGMAVSMAGVFLLIRYDKKDSSVWMPLISGLLMGAGPLIKQSLISSIVFGFYLSWKKNCFKTVVFTSIGLPALICSVLTVISKGDFIKICIVYPSLPPKSMMHSWIIFKSTLLFSPVHFLILGGTILLVIRIALNWISKKDISLSRSSIFIPWVLLSGGLALFTSTRELGGSSLYWLEFIIISSAFLGECLSVIIERISDTQKKQILISVVSVLMIGSGLVFSMRSLRGVMFEWSAIPYYRELQSIVSDKTPPDEPIIEYFSNIGILTQRKVLFNDLLMYQNTTVENRELLNSVIASKKASCLLLLPQFSANYISSDYVEVPTKNAYPNRIFAVKVYLRKDLLTK